MWKWFAWMFTLRCQNKGGNRCCCSASQVSVDVIGFHNEMPSESRTWENRKVLNDVMHAKSGLKWPHFVDVLLWVIHKPFGQLRGRGFSLMTILLHKPYLVKVTTKGGGGGSKISKKFDHVVYGWPIRYLLRTWDQLMLFCFK